jgi:hypothetical protein
VVFPEASRNHWIEIEIEIEIDSNATPGRATNRWNESGTMTPVNANERALHYLLSAHDGQRPDKGAMHAVRRNDAVLICQCDVRCSSRLHAIRHRCTYELDRGSQNFGEANRCYPGEVGAPWRDLLVPVPHQEVDHIGQRRGGFDDCGAAAERSGALFERFEQNCAGTESACVKANIKALDLDDSVVNLSKGAASKRGSVCMPNNDMRRETLRSSIRINRGA